VSSDAGKGGPKTWSQEDMEQALDALRNHNMSLTKASATYGIPSTTLWQRAHRMGIDTPKKEGPTKSWTEENLNNALEALRTGTISANKASKAYGKFHCNPFQFFFRLSLVLHNNVFLLLAGVFHGFRQSLCMNTRIITEIGPLFQLIIHLSSTI
jgi:hypothetical protein